MIKWIGRLFPKFRMQMLIYYIVVIMIPMLLLALFLYGQTVISTRFDAYNKLEKESSEWHSEYKARKQDIEQSAYTIANNPSIQQYFTQLGYSDPDVIKSIINTFRPMMSWFLSTNVEIYRIHFLTYNPVIPDDSYVSNLSHLSGETPKGDILSKEDQGRWLGVQKAAEWKYSKISDELVVTYQQKVIIRPASYMQMDVLASYLFQGISFAIDARDGTILYSKLSPELVGQKLPSNRDTLVQKDLQSLTVGGETFDLVSKEDELLSVIFLKCIPQTDAMLARQQALLNFLILMAALVLLTFTLIRYFTNSVTSRVETIGKMINRIASGDYHVTYESQYNDEIEKLGLDVACLGKKMDHLVNQVLFQELLSREAEFSALQAQINPHFIFNTLESFCMIAEVEGLTHLSDMIAQLGKLMRYNLKHEPKTILSNELDNIRNYIELQNLSHSGRIHLTVSCDPELSECMVLRLMLQPIVENAIMHGMRPDGMLHIAVQINQINDKIRICISNDGKQMSVEEKSKLDSLLLSAREKTTELDGQKIALQNIQRRLVIHYDIHTILAFEQTREALTVWFDIPMRKETLSCG